MHTTDALYTIQFYAKRVMRPEVYQTFELALKEKKNTKLDIYFITSYFLILIHLNASQLPKLSKSPINA